MLAYKFITDMVTYDNTYRSTFELMSAYHPITEELKEELWNRTQPCSFKKDEIMIHENRVSENIYFIIEGFCACFYNKDGKENIIKFFDKGEFTIPYHSFIKKEKSYFSIKATEPVQAISISRKDFEYLWSNHTDFILFYHNCLLKDMINIELYQFQLRSNDAKNRIKAYKQNEYLKFLAKHVPNKAIASYLDMTPETFSALNSEINKRK